jgi:hypothetical protein
VEPWLLQPFLGPFPPPPAAEAPVLKNPEIPCLSSYHFPAPAKFWKSFPMRRLPSSPVSPVRVNELRARIQSAAHLLTVHQRAHASTVLYELVHGADACQREAMPALQEKNAASVYAHGREFTDNLATWIKLGFVAGPFATPPVKNFRVNSMIAVAKKGKVRIVMDLSRPPGLSFNDNVDEARVEKICTASETSFGFSVLECSKGACIWKFDLNNAFKNIPARVSDLRLQGFRWLGRFFIETQQVFGAKTAAAAFDRLGGTLAGLAAVEAGCPWRWIHRTIDDTVVVTPADSDVGDRFAASYKALCAAVGVALADNCPKNEKVFEDQTAGTVLGVRFNTVAQTWSMAPKKFDSIVRAATPGLRGLHMSLSDTQTLLGKLANFCHMCKFLKAFRHQLNAFLASFQDNYDILHLMPEAAAADLAV